MPIIDRYLEAMQKQRAEAISLKIGGPVEMTAGGQTRPVSNRPTAADQVHSLLAEISPDYQTRLQDGRLVFAYPSVYGNFQLQVKVGAAVAAGTVITDTVTVGAANDANAADNSATATDVVALATQDVETIEYFFAHTVAPAFVAVLIALGQINTWFGPGPWYDVVDTAWQRLAPLVPPLSRLKLNGFVQRTADGLIRPGASARNTGGSPTLLRYGPICAPIMRLFRDSSFNGQPLWDAERWWWTSHAGGCKLPPDIALLQPGDSVALGGGGFRVADVLGDSIPPGRYTAAILIRVATPPGDTTYLASAGTLDLSR